MIEEEDLRKLRLSRRPPGQLIAARLLDLNYRWPPANRVEISGVENIPGDRPVFFALNHTDRFNYWPFQWALWKMGGHRFVTSWVKAKYYDNPLMSAFLNQCNNIPLPSLGYVILNDAAATLGRPLTEEEYRFLRDLVDSQAGKDESVAHLDGEIESDVARLLVTPRRDFLPEMEPYAVFILRWAGRLFRLVEERTLEALFSHHNNVLVFPQGTRSLRLLPARTGMLEFALRHDVDIIPVGSNGCERLYPGASPLARRGEVLYRVGKPLTVEGDFGDCRITELYQPFTVEAQAHEDKFVRAASRVTAAINDLLDEPYRLCVTKEGDPSRVGRLS